MIRICGANLWNIVGTPYFTRLSSHISPLRVICTSKRLQTTKISANANNSADNEAEALKKERQIEVHFWHSMGRKCINPSEMSDEQWQHLYGLDTKHQRQKYVNYLLTRKQAKLEKKERAEQRREGKKETRERVLAERTANEHIVYGVGHNTLLLRICRQTLNKWRNRKLMRATLFGQKIVVDCSYDDMLTDVERSKTAKGLKRVYSENRAHSKPLDLHLCGVRLDSGVFRNLSGQIPNLFKKSSLTKMHSECFSELFPKERLVMLTPDSDNEFQYDPHAIYVVGGLVDLGRNEPYTLAKAKRLGIRTARFPLDNIRMREGDTKELTMSTSVEIVRECQMNDDIKNVIRKCVTLKSERKEERSKNQEKDEIRREYRF